MSKNFCCVGKLFVRGLQNSGNGPMLESLSVAGVMSALQKQNSCNVKSESEYFKQRDEQLLLKMASKNKST